MGAAVRGHHHHPEDRGGAFSAPGDSVLIQTPVYAHFHNDVLMNGRHLAYAPLVRTEDGYRFDERSSRGRSRRTRSSSS